MTNIISKKRVSTALSFALFLGLSVSACAYDIGDEKSSTHNKRKGPPPVAFEACMSKEINTSCQVTTPKGTLSGTCQKDKKGDRILCVPEGHPKHKEK